MAIICLIAGLLILPGISESFLKPAVEALLNGTNYAAGVFNTAARMM